MKILEVTGFKTPNEYFNQTSSLERVFISEGVRQLQKQEAKKYKKLMS